MATMSPDIASSGSSFYSVDTILMRSLGEGLVDLAAQSKRHTFGPINGAGEAHAIEEAAARFRATWSPQLIEWATALASFSEHVSAAAAMLESSDAHNAATWRGMTPMPTS